MSYEWVVNTLRDIHWGSSPDWSPSALGMLHDYYRRLAPYWPASRKRVEPADRDIVSAVMGGLTGAETEQIRSACDAISAAAVARDERVEPTTRKLIPLILAWAREVDAGKLAAAAVPGASLMALFTAGFQLKYTDAGIEIHYDTGWMIAPVPTREQLGV